jgi:uncharacterized protein YjlB
VPNNRLPFLVYRGAIDPARVKDPAATIEKIFEKNGWGHGMWRNGIFPFVHYHSQIHEVLDVVAGDVAVLPAGTGHQRISATPDLLVIGAYPPEGHYDLCRGTGAEHARALATIPRVPIPETDPLCGAGGPLTRLWR